MAKSKAQKKAEALARFREMYQEKLAERTSWQPGGKNYKNAAKINQAMADEQHAQSERTFQVYLFNAQLTEHGDPAPEHHQRVMKNFLFDKKPVVDTNEPIYAEREFPTRGHEYEEHFWHSRSMA